MKTTRHTKKAILIIIVTFCVFKFIVFPNWDTIKDFFFNLF